MEINDITEHDDGSATLNITYSAKEVGYLLEKAFIDMLKDYVKTLPSYANNET